MTNSVSSSATELRATAMFCSVLALAMGAIYAGLRIGFGVDWLAIARAEGLALLLVNFPSYWSEKLRGDDSTSAWYRSAAAGGLLVMLLTAFAGLPSTASIAGAAAATLGYLAAARTFVVSARERDLQSKLMFGVTVLVVSLWCAGVTWGSGPENPLALESAAMQGRAGSIDLFFHSALANMISVHGTVTTGIDGLVGTNYHIGTHWLFGRWAGLIGQQVIDFYLMGYQIIIPAVWFMALASLALQIRRLRGSTTFEHSFRVVVLIVLGASVIGSLPYPMVAAGGFGVSPFLSESYAVALLAGFYLAGAAVAHFASATAQDRDQSLSNKRFEWLLALAIIPAGITALAFLKVSTVLFTIPALAWLVFRLRLYRRPAWIGGTLLTIVLVFVSLRGPLRPIAPGIARPGITLFSYLNYQLPLKWWPFFLTLHFFWSWVYVLVRLRREGITSFGQLVVALKERRLVDAEIVTLTALACLAPGVLLPVSLDGFYFSDQPRWASVALVVGDVWLLSRLSGGLAKLRARGFFGFAPMQMLAMLVGIPLVLSFVITLFSWPVALVRTNLMTRKDVSVLSGEPLLSLQERARSRRMLELFDAGMIHKGLANAPGADVIAALKNISRLPLSERRRTALYIPKSVTAYWDFYRTPRNCNWTGFVAPALAAVAMIDGLPPGGCEIGRNHGYGMAAFRVDGRWPGDRTLSDSELCTKSASWGFSEVLIAESTGSGIRVRSLLCEA